MLETQTQEKLFESIVLGKTWKSAAEEAGLSVNQAKRIIRNMYIRMMQLDLLGFDVVPGDGRFNFNLNNLRDFPDFWLRQLLKWKEWLEKEHFYNKSEPTCHTYDTDVQLLIDFAKNNRFLTSDVMFAVRRLENAMDAGIDDYSMVE